MNQENQNNSNEFLECDVPNEVENQEELVTLDENAVVIGDVEEIIEPVVVSHQNSKRFRWLVITIISLVVVLAVSGYFAYSSYMKKEVLKYSERVEKYVSEVKETMIDIEYIGKGWDIALSSESSYVFAYGMNLNRTLNSYSISEAKENKPKIEALCDELLETELNYKYVDELKSEIQEIQDSYELAYEIIIGMELSLPSSVESCNTNIKEITAIIETIKSEFGKPIADDEC